MLPERLLAHGEKKRKLQPHVHVVKHVPDATSPTLAFLGKAHLPETISAERALRRVLMPNALGNETITIIACPSEQAQQKTIANVNQPNPGVDRAPFHVYSHTR